MSLADKIRELKNTEKYAFYNDGVEDAAKIADTNEFTNSQKSMLLYFTRERYRSEKLYYEYVRNLASRETISSRACEKILTLLEELYIKLGGDKDALQRLY